MNKLKRMDIDLFKDGTFRLNAHFDGVGFGMNFPKQPDWKKVVIRLHSLADMIDSHFAERTEAAQQSAEAGVCFCSSDKKHSWKDYTMGHVVLCEWCGSRR